MGRKDIEKLSKTTLKVILQIPDKFQKKNPKLVVCFSPKLKVPTPCYCNNHIRKSPHFVDLCNAHGVHIMNLKC